MSAIPEKTAARRHDRDPEPYRFPDDSAERRRLRLALAVALAFHALLLVLPTPQEEAQAAEEAAPRKVVVLQPVRFKPPPDPPPEPIPREEVVEIPVPDATPDDLEPIRPELEMIPVDDDLDLDSIVWDVPTEPPPPAPTEPILVGGEVARPRPLHTPKPLYTETARKVRIQGPVILQLTLTKEGLVRDVEVLRGRPMGLTEAAVEAVREWRYEPALLNGKPVEVYMTITINFTLY